jgi:hypothetical protein
LLVSGIRVINGINGNSDYRTGTQATPANFPECIFVKMVVHMTDGDRAWVQAWKQAATQGEDKEHDKDVTKPTMDFGTDGRQDLGGVDGTMSSRARRIVQGPGYLGQHGDDTTMEQHTTIKKITGEGGGDGGGNSDDGNDNNDNDDDAKEQTLPQMERMTGANVHCRPQQQCSSCNDGSTQLSKYDWQQVTMTYTLMDGKSATADAIRSNPVNRHNNQLQEMEGRNKVVVAVATTMERKATMAARG